MSDSVKTILILDYGSQYTQLIARRIRECNTFSRIIRFDTSAEELRALAPAGIILSGGPASVYAEGAPQVDPAIFDLGIPILGICYGLQLTIQALGGRVAPGNEREFGDAKLTFDEPEPFFQGLGESQSVWMSHGDKVHELPEGFHTIAHTANSEYAAVANTKRRIYGLQFHPEVAHTPNGTQMLRNFCYDICGCTGDWTMESFIETKVAEIREQVGDHQVILGLSGGVDSSIAAALIHKAIGDQLICIFVNNGLLRLNEADRVRQLFGDNFKFRLDYVDASDRFLDKLAGVSDPEAKRKVIGNEFVYVFNDEAVKFRSAKFLGQGTTYPDVIESVPIGGNPAAMIKSHHNVGGLPDDMEMELVEPLRRLFKDEVREVGRQLGLPKEVVWRQPFPGPGLGVRILGEVTREAVEVLQRADAIVVDEMKKADLYYSTWQAFAVLLPIRSVGVMGDERTYENAVAIRIVESQDGMTADWAKIPYEILGRMSSRIINEVRGVNRVCYDISSKPPATIEWE